MNVIVPGDNERRKRRKKISKEIIFNSDTINMPLSEWSPLIPVLGACRGSPLAASSSATEHGLGGKHGMPVQHFTDF